MTDGARASSDIVVDGVRLEIRHWAGRGMPILMLHEGLGSIAIWRDFPDALAVATGRPVIAWSRPGYGWSDPPPGPRAIDYLHREAEAVPALLDALDLEAVHLFGHSDGASLALLVAALAPARVASVVVEAPHVFVEGITVAGVAAARRDYATSGLGRRLARYHRDPDAVFWRWNDIWLDPGFRAWTIEDVLPRIVAPMLLIQGHGDEYGTMEQLDRIAAVLPDATRLALDDCGHSPHREQPDAVLDAVTRFLDGRP